MRSHPTRGARHRPFVPFAATLGEMSVALSLLVSCVGPASRWAAPPASEALPAVDSHAVALTCAKPGRRAFGQGVLLEPGVLLTARHVALRASGCMAGVGEAAPIPVRGVLRDWPDLDVVMLRVDEQRLPSGSLEVGPLPPIGARVRRLTSVSSARDEAVEGLVASDLVTGSRVGRVFYVRMTARPGMSGSCFVDEAGRAVGILVQAPEGMNLVVVVPLDGTIPGPQDRRALPAARLPLDLGAGDPAHRSVLAARDAFDRGDSAMALSLATDALGREPTELHRAMLLLTRGSALRRLGHEREASTDFQQALRLRPRFPEVLKSLAVCHRALGQFPEAIAVADRGLQLMPNWADMRCERADGLTGLGRPMEARAEYEQAVRDDPAHGRAHFGVGFVAHEAGDWTVAAAAFEQSEALGHRAAEAAAMAGQGYELAGELDRAVAAFRRAIQHDPREPRVRAHLVVALAKQGDREASSSELTTLRRIDARIAAAVERELASAAPPR